MGGFTPNQNDIIVKLKLDPSQLRAGYQSAKGIQAQANSEMLALDAQRVQMRGQLESQYTTAMRAQIAQRVADLRTELAQTIGAMQNKSGAEKAALMASADATRTKLQQQLQEMENYKA